MTENRTEWDAIVLAGGRSSRLGGVDKTALLIDGVSLLERAIAAVSGARRIVVVGPAGLRDRLPEYVELVTESPRFGGPAAATAGGVTALGSGIAPRVAIIAADLPFAAEALAELFALGRLAAFADGVIATDSTGRSQSLLGIYTSAALSRSILDGNGRANASMRRLTAGMLLCRVRLPDRLCADIDTPLAARLHGVAFAGEPSFA